jgi:mRNA interferase MazF
MAGGLTRGEVRLVRFPEPDKARPALIVTRQSILGSLTSVTVAPITATVRGVPSEVALGVEDGMKQPCAVNLLNLATLRVDRLGRIVTVLSADRMAQVCRALAHALGCGP